MTPRMKLIAILSLTLLPVLGVIGYGVWRGLTKDDDSGTGAAGSYLETDWRILRGLDYQTGKRSPEVEAIDGKFVKVPGFVVPLDDDAASYSEFLLVPSPQACIHAPAPPPNQMIFVRMKGGAAPQRSWGPVWIMGRLHASTMDSQYGKISYMLHGDKAEPYRMPDEPLPPP